MRATRALIHVENLRQNIRFIRNHVGDQTKVCLAVKADAYGHGIVEIARVAAESGVEYVAVATVDEASELRAADIGLPILVYSLPTPEEIGELVTSRAIPVVADRELADLLATEAARQGVCLPVHLKVDTGMGRIGCDPSHARALAEHVTQNPHLDLAGLSTHFASADEPDRTLTETQILRFTGAINEIRASGINPGIIHASNSGGTIGYPSARFDMVRPGILAYGYSPSPEMPPAPGLLPVMELQSRLVFIKKVEAGATVSYGATWSAPRQTCIGTIPVGYGDGYNRLLSNRGEVLIGGSRYPIVGRVCMDHVMVDLGPVPRVSRFEPVTLFGPDPAGPDAQELAALCDTIPYEVTCALSKRVPRVYLE